MGKKKSRTLVTLAQGTGIALGLYLGFLLLFALLAVKGPLGEEQLPTLLAIGAAAALFAGGRFAARRAGLAPIAGTLAVTGAFWVILLLLGILVFDGPMLGEAAIPLLAASLLGGAAAAFVGKKRKKGRVRAK